MSKIVDVKYSPITENSTHKMINPVFKGDGSRLFEITFEQRIGIPAGIVMTDDTANILKLKENELLIINS